MEVEDAQKVKKIVPNPDYSAWIARDQAVTTRKKKSPIRIVCSFLFRVIVTSCIVMHL
jgi:hypothetical protein